jgi:hypothetical protein
VKNGYGMMNRSVAANRSDNIQSEVTDHHEIISKVFAVNRLNYIHSKGGKLQDGQQVVLL